MLVQSKRSTGAAVIITGAIKWRPRFNPLTECLRTIKPNVIYVPGGLLGPQNPSLCQLQVICPPQRDSNGKGVKVITGKVDELHECILVHVL